MCGWKLKMLLYDENGRIEISRFVSAVSVVRVPIYQYRFNVEYSFSSEAILRFARRKLSRKLNNEKPNLH